jgi:hypothetical protein
MALCPCIVDAKPCLMARPARHPRRVILGVPRRAAGHPAVRWAVEEASLRETSLVITPLDTESAVQDPVLARLRADELLEGIVTVATLHAPSVPVGTQLSRGDVHEHLRQLSRTAALLVIANQHGPGSAELSRPPGLFRLGSVTSCPVMVVSESTAWPKSEVLGIWAGRHPRTVLDVAADAAALRGWRLIVSAPVLVPAGGTISPSPLEEGLAALRRRHPRLHIELPTSPGATRRSEPGGADAALCILGCGPGDNPAVGAAALGREELFESAAGPVVLVGPRAGPGAP